MAPRNIRKTALTERQVDILEDRLDDFNDAAGGRTKKETTARRQEIREEVTTALWKINPGESNRTKDELEKCIGSWFNNHKIVEASKKTTRRVWKGRDIFAQDEDWKERICDEAEKVSQHPSGTREFLGAFQPVLKGFWDSLPSQTQEVYAEIAAEWNAKSLPREVQLRELKKKGDKPIREFAQNMFKELGTRVFVLSATKNSDDEVVVSWHDFNEDLGYEGFPTAETKWNSGPVFDVWSSYAQAAFDGDLADVLIKAKNTISEIKLQLDKSGLPILPDPLPTSRPDLDSTVRQFVTGYYRVASGKPKVKVPWKAIAKSQDDFFDPDVMPESFLMMEPSKFHVKDLVTLLNHWKTVGFQFQYYEEDGKMEDAEDQIPEKVKGKGKAKIVGQEGQPGASTRKKPAPTPRKSGKGTTAKPANRGGKARLPSRESDSSDADESSEDSSKERLSAKEGPGPSKTTAREPRNIGATPRDTGSTSNPEKSQIQYLQSLSTRTEYRDLIGVVYAASIGGASTSTAQFPKFADWNWNDPHLPRSLHVNDSKIDAVLKWLDHKPYLDKAGDYMGRSVGEKVTLAVGLLIQDINGVQFPEDAENEEDIPDVFEDSVLEFALVDDVLLPFCTEMIADITVSSPPPSGRTGKAPIASTSRHQLNAGGKDKDITAPASKTPDSRDLVSAAQGRLSNKPRTSTAVLTSSEDSDNVQSDTAAKEQKASSSKRDSHRLKAAGGTIKRGVPAPGTEAIQTQAPSTQTGKKRKRHSKSGENGDVGEDGQQPSHEEQEQAEVDVVPAKTKAKRNAPLGVQERSQPSRGAKTNHTQVGTERKEPKKKVGKVPASKPSVKKRNRQ